MATVRRLFTFGLALSKHIAQLPNIYSCHTFLADGGDADPGAVLAGEVDVPFELVPRVALILGSLSVQHLVKAHDPLLDLLRALGARRCMPEKMI